MVESACKDEGIEQTDYRFSRRQVRSVCGWSETQVRAHMQRLMDMEYLLTHRGGRGQSFEYELLYCGEGEGNNAFVMGLLDVEQLKSTEKTDSIITTMGSSRGELKPSRGQGGKFAGSSRPQRGTVAELEKTLQPLNGKAYNESSRETTENSYRALV